MNTELQAELTAIKEQCRKAIELGDKATPGPWEADSLSEKFVWPQGCDNNNGEIIKVYTARSRQDCSLIAHARTFSPAAARALLTTIEALETTGQLAWGMHWQKWPGHEHISNALQSIADNWTDL